MNGVVMLFLTVVIGGPVGVIGDGTTLEDG